MEEVNIFLVIAGIFGVACIFALAAWAGPKVIRAMYPEEDHERMIKSHRMMVIIAILVGIMGLTSGLMPFLSSR